MRLEGRQLIGKHGDPMGRELGEDEALVGHAVLQDDIVRRDAVRAGEEQR